MSRCVVPARNVGWAALIALGTAALVASRASRSWPLFYVSAAALVVGFLWLAVVALVGLARSLYAISPDPCGAPDELLGTLSELAVAAGVPVPPVTLIRVRARRARVVVEAAAAEYQPRPLDRYSPLAALGVLGHEVAHIAKGHVDRFTRRGRARLSRLRYQREAAIVTLAAMHLVSWAWPLALVCSAPVTAVALTPAKRRHELEVDRLGARLTSVAAQLAALDALAAFSTKPERETPGRLERLVSTHPTIAERHAALLALDEGDDAAASEGVSGQARRPGRPGPAEAGV